MFLLGNKLYSVFLFGIIYSVCRVFDFTGRVVVVLSWVWIILDHLAFVWHIYSYIYTLWRGRIYRLLCCPCPLGGTKPNPEAPTITPLDSIGPSVGGSGNTTGPTYKKNIINKYCLIKSLHEFIMVNATFSF